MSRLVGRLLEGSAFDVEHTLILESCRVNDFTRTASSYWLKKADWSRILDGLDVQGSAVIEGLIDPIECAYPGRQAESSGYAPSCKALACMRRCVVAPGRERPWSGDVDTLPAQRSPMTGCTYFLWRPQLKDPNDEMVLEAAVNGAARFLVTVNSRDFEVVAKRFGIEICLPGQFLKILEKTL